MLADAGDARRARREVHSRPRRLWLLSIAHAVNHAQAVLLPLIYLADHRRVRRRRRRRSPSSPRPAAFASGSSSRATRSLTRHVSRRTLLGAGGLLFGGGFAAQALAPSFADLRRHQRRVADRRLAAAPGRQRPARRAVPAGAARASRSAPTSRGGNVGTVVVALVGAWLIARPRLARRRRSSSASRPSLIALAILLLVRESGADRAAAVAHGSVREAFADDPARPRPSAGSTSRPSSAAAAAASASSTCSRCST